MIEIGEKEIRQHLKKWQDILRLRDWDIVSARVSSPSIFCLVRAMSKIFFQSSTMVEQNLYTKASTKHTKGIVLVEVEISSVRV